MKGIANLLNFIKTGLKLSARVIIHKKAPKHLSLVLNSLYREGYIQSYKYDKNKNTFVIFLRYTRQGKTTLKHVRIFSQKESLLTVFKLKHLWLFSRGTGGLFISTKRGVLSHREALNQGVGGQALFYIS